MTTRNIILNEALTLFAENGYDGTSVEEIVEKVGIKAPSLFGSQKQTDSLNVKRNVWKASNGTYGTFAMCI